MPCGGIYPIVGSIFESMFNPNDPGHNCFECGKSDTPPTHFCDEWDCYLHKECIDAFLAGPEGQIVIHHKHEIIR